MNSALDTPGGGAAAPAEAKLTDHLYDGIREYDNPLPGWWTWLFALSVVFSFFYWIYFHFGTPGRTIHDQFDAQAAAVFELRFKEIGELTPDADTIVKFMTTTDPELKDFIKVGESVYKANCVSCHGGQGEGNVGPNLTDDNWKNVKKIEDIATVIQNGAANGAMPAWKTRLGHMNRIVLTASYVASLRGRTPEGVESKKAEGDPIPPWSSGSATETPSVAGQGESIETPPVETGRPEGGN